MDNYLLDVGHSGILLFRYAPMSDIVIADIYHSRSTLLKGHVVLLLSEADSQYHNILKFCGAIPFAVFSAAGVGAYIEFLDKHGLGGLNTSLSAKLEGSTSEFVFSKFHDDCRPLIPLIKVHSCEI